MTHEKFKIQRKSFRITLNDEVIDSWIDTNYFHGPIIKEAVIALVDNLKKMNAGQTYRIVHSVTTEEEIYQC